MIILDGKKLSEIRIAELAERVGALESGQRPGLVVIRVGDDPASKIYVTKKVETCRKIGFFSEEIALPASTSEAALGSHIERLNRDERVHGILLQLPLPSSISEQQVLGLIHPAKDVDGFHVINRGRLFANQPCLQPCTPKGIMTLLEHYRIELQGLNAVVIGRSLIVGRPMSLMLDAQGATVTVVHSKTRDIGDHLGRADLIVSAVGKPHFVSQQKLKDGVILIDVGINRLASGKIVGDIDLAAYAHTAGFGSPVPGGVGPMTICSLLENTWQAFKAG